MLSIFLVAFAALLIHPHNTEAQATGPEAKPQGAHKVTDVMESKGSFSLERCIEIALAKNPEIAAAQWDISGANSRLDVALTLVRNRRAGGMVSDLDVVQAETVLKTAEAQVPDNALQRAKFEHALAVLTYREQRLSFPCGGAAARPPAPRGPTRFAL